MKKWGMRYQVSTTSTTLKTPITPQTIQNILDLHHPYIPPPLDHHHPQTPFYLLSSIQ